MSQQRDALQQDAADVFVTVLMPCLNEAPTLAACIQQAHAGCQDALANRPRSPCSISETSAAGEADGPLLPAENDQPRNVTTLPSAYEIVIADNGSTDGSPEIATENGARVVHVPRKGYGAALMAGIAAARGKYVVMGDSDCSYDFREVPRFIEKLEEGSDLVVGNRFARGIMPGAMPWHHRYIGNPVLSGLGRLLYRTPVRDWHCGLRAFDRKTIVSLQLRSSGMEFASEMVLRSARSHLSAKEIAITLHPDRRHGRPHLRSFRDGVRHVLLLLHAWSCLAILTIVSPGCWERQGPGASGSTTDAQEYQFGIVPPGSKLTHAFVLKNLRNDTMTINRAVTSCGCTSATFSTDTVPPGEYCTVNVALQTTTASADNTQHVAVYTDGSASPAFRLTLKATVRNEICIDRNTLNVFIQGDAHESPPPLFVHNFSPAPWASLAVRGDIPGLNFDIVRLPIPRDPAATETWHVAIAVSTDASPGSGTLTFEADTGARAECQINVVAPVFVNAFPATLVLNKSNSWSATTTLCFATPELASLLTSASFKAPPNVQIDLLQRDRDSQQIRICILDPSKFSEGPHNITLALGKVVAKDILALTVYSCD